MIDFQTDPSHYRHWRIEITGTVAHLIMDVDEDGGLFDGYQLKLNSYDLGVDIELADAVQRLRFEHPEVSVVVLKSGKDKVFCAGANIRMLAGASHAHKVNFCKFTNETRTMMEDSGRDSGQSYIAAVSGACAGGGYELALATDYILLTDDSQSSVALPEVPLLAVLPGTGGLTRVTDKRKVRRDLADIFCSTEEGIRGKRAVDWKLVDETVPNSKFDEALERCIDKFASRSDRPKDAKGITLGPLSRRITETSLIYSSVNVDIDRDQRIATLTITVPDEEAPATPDDALSEGDQFWMLRAAREVDDAILHLRLNEMDLAVWQIKTVGDPVQVLAHEKLLSTHPGHWLMREVRLLWKRVLKRLDVTSRTLVALIEPGSAFAGTFAEFAFACDRSYMALGAFEGDNRPEATLTLSEMNFGAYPMANGLTRIETRFLDDDAAIEAVRDSINEGLEADEAAELGLVTFAYDDIDWDDEVRLFLEERASFSADALTGMEANLRFAGPETMETRIFGRLTAWQNWIFQRPNAVGPDGALQRYGSGQRPELKTERV